MDDNKKKQQALILLGGGAILFLSGLGWFLYHSKGKK